MNQSLIDHRFKRHVLFGYASQGIGSLASLVAVLLVTRFAGIETYGMVAMLTALAGLTTNLLTFRTNEAVVVFYKRGQLKDDPGTRRLALLAGMTLDLVTGLALFGLIGLAAPAIAARLLKEPDASAGVELFAFVVLLNLLRATPLGLLTANERFRFINSLTASEQILKAVTIAAMLWAGTELTFERVVWAFLLPSAVVTLTVYHLPVRLLLGGLRRARAPGGMLGEYARFSSNTFLSTALKAGNQNVDTIILGYLSQPTEVGLYNLMRQFLIPVSMLAAPFASQILPAFVAAVARHQSNEIRATIRHADRLMLAGSLVMLIFIIPAFLLFENWNGLLVGRIHHVTFGVVILNTLLMQQLWWGRPWSLGTDPFISLQANALATLCVLVGVPALTAGAGVLGCALGMLGRTVMVRSFFQASLRRATQGERSAA